VTDLELLAAQERLRILDALVKALDRRAEVMTLIADAEDGDIASERLAQVLDVTKMGATAIVNLQLHRFTRGGVQRIRAERDDQAAALGVD
jgi:DNA gyrase/topoisomerase IV subunit A